MDLQRAEIAWARGDLPSARAFVELAAVRPSLGMAAKATAVNARALRAVVSAASGELAQARADIEAVRSSAVLFPQAIARADLAQAILWAREGTGETLAAHLANQRDILRQGAPRERAAARVLDQFARGADRRSSSPDAPLVRSSLMQRCSPVERSAHRR